MAQGEPAVKHGLHECDLQCSSSVSLVCFSSQTGSCQGSSQSAHSKTSLNKVFLNSGFKDGDHDPMILR